MESDGRSLLQRGPDHCVWAVCRPQPKRPLHPGIPDQFLLGGWTATNTCGSAAQSLSQSSIPFNRADAALTWSAQRRISLTIVSTTRRASKSWSWAGSPSSNGMRTSCCWVPRAGWSTFTSLVSIRGVVHCYFGVDTYSKRTGPTPSRGRY